MKFKEFIADNNSTESTTDKIEEAAFSAIYGRLGNDAKKLLKHTCQKMNCDAKEAAESLSVMFKEMAKQGIY